MLVLVCIPNAYSNETQPPNVLLIFVDDRFPQIQDEASRIYAAMTSALDDSVGPSLDTIEEHGLENNTLVMFTSDNGVGVAAFADNTPLRLGKHITWTGTVLNTKVNGVAKYELHPPQKS